MRAIASLSPTAKIDGGGVVGGDRSCFNGYSLYQKPGMHEKTGFLSCLGPNSTVGTTGPKQGKNGRRIDGRGENSLGCRERSPVEGYPQSYTVQFILNAGPRGEGKWPVQAAIGLAQEVHKLKTF